ACAAHPVVEEEKHGPRPAARQPGSTPRVGRLLCNVINRPPEPSAPISTCSTPKPTSTSSAKPASATSNSSTPPSPGAGGSGWLEGGQRSGAGSSCLQVVDSGHRPTELIRLRGRTSPASQQSRDQGPTSGPK